MDADTVLILGLLTVGFSIPTMVSAISDSRAPRAAIVTTLVGGSLIFYAFKHILMGMRWRIFPTCFQRDCQIYTIGFSVLAYFGC